MLLHFDANLSFQAFLQLICTAMGIDVDTASLSYRHYPGDDFGRHALPSKQTFRPLRTEQNYDYMVERGVRLLFGARTLRQTILIKNNVRI